MNERALRVLEYTKVRQMLAERAASPMGKALCESLEPSGDYTAVLELQRETAEAESFYRASGHHPVPAFDDIRASLRRAHLGGVLGMGELLMAAGALRAGRQVYGELDNALDEDAALRGHIGGLYSDRALEEEITRCILSSDEMADGASSQLSNIRRQMRVCQDRVREKLQQLTRSAQFSKYLQEPIVTIRNERFCVPVKSEYRAQVPGMIHDQSSSGATLFVEPMAVVQINNDLKQLLAAERDEIERILMELSASLAQGALALIASLEALARLDAVFAKAVLGRNMRAAAPRLNQSGRMRIAQGRHPLIADDAVVPIDLHLGESFTSLVITGPNTGGKTVTLKTAGLFALMAQSGMHLPAAPGTSMPVFSQVFADIGDEQSIEQSLSTFSSHMTHIVDILNTVEDGALVLFDELCAGTDPAEGAALAMAILESVTRRGIRTMASTHYSELKAFALSHPGVANAAMEFDINLLRPTFRLSIGIPGRSNAFEISARLGLSQSVIGRAREHLSQETVRFEDVLMRAERESSAAREMREEIELLRAQALEEKERVEKQSARLDAQRDKLIAQAREDARRIVQNARAEMDAVIRELKELSALEHEKERDRAIQSARERIKGVGDALGGGQGRPRTSAGAPPEGLKPGDRVLLVDLNQKGAVIAAPDAKGEVQVQVGLMRLTLPLAGLRLLEDQEKPKKEQGHSRSVGVGNRSIGLELDLRGHTLDEALLKVDKYLDEAYLAAFSEVNIIHGKGTGALRSGVQQHLRAHPRVESFRPGRYGEGDAGVTVVKLK